ncbi:MAG: sortase [Candidatus Peregrinibacteria bacterium]
MSIGVFLCAQTLAFGASFPDVQGSSYETAFTYLSGKHVVQGYSDGSGRPFNFLNRAEALKILTSLKVPARVTFFQSSMPPLPLFYDTEQSAWYAKYIEAAYEAKMITGYADRTFRPGNILTTEEAVTMLLRAYGAGENSQAARLSPYIQNRDSQWYTPFVNGAIAKNLIMHSVRLELGRPISRGNFFDLAYRLDFIQSQGLAAFSGPEPAGGASAVSPAPRVVVSQPGSPIISAPQPATAASPYASERYFAITMPDLGITDLTVTHPSDPFTAQGILQPLQYGVGHLFSYPGAGGKIMIYGHSSGYPWDVSQFTKIFRKVNQLKVGSRIYVTYNGKLFTYEVTSTQAVPAADTTPFRDNGSGEELILYTCWPPDSISQRYLVHALPVGTVAVR